MISQQNKNSSSSTPHCQFKDIDKQSNQNTGTMQSLSIQQIQKLLDDMRVEYNQNDNQDQETSKINQKQIKDNQQNIQEDPLAELVQAQDEIKLEDIGISTEEIVFGQHGLIPGTIDEVDFSISLNPKEINQSGTGEMVQQPTNILRIIAICRNQEFDSLDEYVFSVRSNNSYEYYEEIRFKIKRGQRADIKVAVKIPSLKQNYVINGIIEVRLQNLEPIIIPIVAKCIVPQIVCYKALYNQKQGTNVIRIPAKKCMQRTPPIPFKNLSPFNLSLQCEAISHQSFENKPYDILVQNFVGCHANAQFFVNMQVKQNINYVGILPNRAFIRKILLLKVKNSSVIFHFPIEVCVFQGQNLQGN